MLQECTTITISQYYYVFSKQNKTKKRKCVKAIFPCTQRMLFAGQNECWDPTGSYIGSCRNLPKILQDPTGSSCRILLKIQFQFQFDQESDRRRTTSWMCYLQIIIIHYSLFIRILKGSWTRSWQDLGRILAGSC